MYDGRTDFECCLDVGSALPWTSSSTFPSLPMGIYTFEVVPLIEMSMSIQTPASSTLIISCLSASYLGGKRQIEREAYRLFVNSGLGVIISGVSVKICLIYFKRPVLYHSFSREKSHASKAQRESGDHHRWKQWNWFGNRKSLSRQRCICLSL